MKLTELHELYDQMKQLEQHLRHVKAPGSMTHRAHSALLAISWAIDQKKAA